MKPSAVPSLLPSVIPSASRNEFTTEEKSLQALCDFEVKGIVNYSVLGQLILSRKRITHSKDTFVMNNIIVEGNENRVSFDASNEQKQYAMITIRCGEVVVEADMGSLRDIEINGSSFYCSINSNCFTI